MTTTSGSAFGDFVFRRTHTKTHGESVRAQISSYGSDAPEETPGRSRFGVFTRAKAIIVSLLLIISLIPAIPAGLSAVRPLSREDALIIGSALELALTRMTLVSTIIDQVVSTSTSANAESTEVGPRTNIPEQLMAASAPQSDATIDPLTQSQLDAAASSAIAQWAEIRPDQDFSSVVFEISDLADGKLAETSGSHITVDTFGAGYGWDLSGAGTSDGTNKMHLITVLSHELGHVLGLEHADKGLMAATLEAGQVKRPEPVVINDADEGAVTKEADVWEVDIAAGTGKLVFDGTTVSFGEVTRELSEVARIEVNGTDGDDHFEVVTTEGTLPTISVNFRGGRGSDLIKTAETSTPAKVGKTELAIGQVLIVFSELEQFVEGASRSLAFGASSLLDGSALDPALLETSTLKQGGKHLGIATAVDGGDGVDEVQILKLKASSGKFKLRFEDLATELLDVSTIDEQILASSLGNLEAIGTGNVSVARTSGLNGNEYAISFIGEKAGTDVMSIGTEELELTGVDEQQTLGLSDVVGGTLTLSLWLDLDSDGLVGDGEFVRTAAIEVQTSGGPSALQIEEALDLALSSLGGDVTVTSLSSGLYLITFQGALAGLDIPILMGEATGLIGPALAKPAGPDPITTTQNGSGVGEQEQVSITSTNGGGGEEEVALGEPNLPTRDNGLQVVTIELGSSGTSSDPTQQLKLRAIGGTFTLSFSGVTTDPIPYNASAQEIFRALESLPPIGRGNLSVLARGPPTGYTSAFDIIFTGALAETEVPLLVADGTLLIPIPADLDSAHLFSEVSGWTPPADAVLVSPSQGGTVTVGEVQVTFSPGSFPSDAFVLIRPVDLTIPGFQPTSAIYDLTAFDAITGQIIASFDVQPELSISVDSKWVPQQIFYLDPVEGPIALESSHDRGRGRVSTRLAHFSHYASAVASGVWTIDLPDGSDHTVSVAVVGADLRVTVDGDAPENKALASITRLVINGGDGADSVTILPAGLTIPVTFNGDTGTDTIIASHSQNLQLTSGFLFFTGGPTITLDNIQAARLTITGTLGKTIDASAFGGTVTLTGGDGDDTLKTGSGGGTLSGGLGNDKYVFGPTFGAVTINAPDDGIDMLDFTGHTGSLEVSLAKTLLTSSDGISSVSQTGAIAEEIDVLLLTGAKAKLSEGFTNLSTYITQLQGAVHELKNVLVLLDVDSAASLSKIIDLVDGFLAFATQISAAVNGVLGATPDLQDILLALQGLALPGVFSGTTFGTDYRRSPVDGKLEALIDVDLPLTAVTSPLDIDPSTAGIQIALDLGEKAKRFGLSFDTSPSTPGVQPPIFTIDARLGYDLAVGLTTVGTPLAFLTPGSDIDLSVNASIPSLTGISLNLAFLEATVTSGSLTFTGSINLAAGDPNSDGRLTLTPLETGTTSQLVTVSPGSLAESFSANVAVSFGASPRVQVLGQGALATANLAITLIGGSLFGTAGVPPDFNVSYSASGISLNLLENTGNFGNIGPNEILGMLGQIADLLGAMAGAQALQTSIPFTDVTIGDALDYARAFKRDILDPLFKSGDALKPDANADGRVDLEDFNFNGINTLLARLEAALGLSPNTLTATYNPTTKELRFNFNFDRSYGFFTTVNAIGIPIAMVTTAREGGSTNEIQEVLVNATGGSFRLGFEGARTDLIAFNAADTTVDTRLEALDGTPGGSDFTVDLVNGVYRITFTGDHATKNVGLLGVDGSGLTNDGTKQTVLVPGDAGTFWLAYPDSGNRLELTDKLTWESPALTVEDQLEGLQGITDVTVTRHRQSLGTLATPTTYIITFNTPSTNVKRLVSAGGLSFNLGQSFGDLADIQAQGDVIPLAGLVARATFGIDLSPSQTLEVKTSAFVPGPRVDVRAIEEGGKAVDVRTMREGGAVAGMGEIQVLTVRGAPASSWRLMLGTTSSSSLLVGADIAAVRGAIESLSTSYPGKITVSKRVSPLGDVYTISYDSTLGNVGQFVGDSGSLTPRNEKQQVSVVNANGGNFTLSFGAGVTAAIDHLASGSTMNTRLEDDLDGVAGGDRFRHFLDRNHLHDHFRGSPCGQRRCSYGERCHCPARCSRQREASRHRQFHRCPL